MPAPSDVGPAESKPGGGPKASAAIRHDDRTAKSLADKTLFISGASRGIGLAIAVRAAQDGANVALIAKTAEPHPKLEGTVYTAAEEIEGAGGSALPMVGDVRNDEDVDRAVAETVERFGGIDICINHA